MNPYLIIGAICLLGLSHAGMFAYGQHVQQAETALAEQDARTVAAAEKEALQAAVVQLSTELEAARAAQRPRDRIITREVVRYAQLPPDRRCALDGAWRVLHDAAATGNPDPVATGLAADQARPVADATALDTVAGNYQTCRELIKQVQGWQAWWNTVQPNTPK